MIDKEFLRKIGLIEKSIVPDEINVKFIEKYYTEKGYKALCSRLNLFLKLSFTLKESDFPYKTRKLLGFPILYIESKEELFFRIKELCESLFITNIKLGDNNGN